MHKFFLSVTLAALTTACTMTSSSTSSETAVVVGQLENISYESSGDPDDLLGHGTISARLHVSHIVRGHLPGRVIDVRYFAHSFYGDQTPARFQLKRMSAGYYIICTPPGRTGYKCKS